MLASKGKALAACLGVALALAGAPAAALADGATTTTAGGTTAATATAAGWRQSGGRWWYAHANGGYAKGGWEKIDDEWYLFDNAGWMLSGWQRSGAWYWLGSDGAMKTGWQFVNGSWYWLGSDGAMRTGWQKVSSQRWQGRGWGWCWGWYYFNGSGAMATGWQWIGGKCYYFRPSGEMAYEPSITSVVEVDGKHYTLNEDGSWHGEPGWFQRTGRSGIYYMYIKADGTCAYNEWQMIDGKWYYFDNDGVMNLGSIEINSKVYCFNEDGSWHGEPGWFNAVVWYYVNSDGTCATGWLQAGGKWYYFDMRGRMLTGTKHIGDTWYVFDENGAWTGESHK